MRPNTPKRAAIPRISIAEPQNWAAFMSRKLRGYCICPRTDTLTYLR